MSPEQARGEELDGSSDFYGLGAVAYYALVGHPPFDGDDALAILHAHLHDPVPEPELRSDRERRVFSLVHGLLAKEPAGRKQAVELIRKGRSRTYEDRPDPASTSTLPHRAFRWLRERTGRFWIGTGVLGVAVLAILGRDAASAACRQALPDASDDDRALLLEPVGTIQSGSEIDVAFTACGLPEDQPFQARITVRAADGGGVVGGVRRFFGGGDDPVRVTWSDESDGFGTARSRTVDPGGLDAGSYRLILEIEDVSGREVEADHEFTVVGR